MKLSAIRLPTANASATTASGSPKASKLIGKLQTPEGQALLKGLVDVVAQRATSESGMLEPGGEPAPSGDVFQDAIVNNLYSQFIRQHDVRDGTMAALAEQFAGLADHDGRVDVAKVQKSLGPSGVRFFTQLNAIKGKSGDPLADRRTLEPIFTETAQSFGRTDPIAPKMAALDTILKQVAKKDELKGFSFMGLQHLFASSATLFDAIGELGVKDTDMRLVGKVYSTNYRVVAEMESRGATVDQVSKKVGSKDFAEAMDEGIESQLQRIIDTLPRPNIFTAEGRKFSEEPSPRVLLIDDGAEAIRILHEKFPEHAPFFVCVEQTRRGARILHELEEKGELKCAVANVAETWAKLEWESPMIGHSVVLEVNRKLDRLERAGIPEAKNSLVMGCGAVGGGVARAMLRRGMDIHLYDKDDSRSHGLRDALVAEGFDASKIHVHDEKQNALRHAEVLVSCVGVRTLQEEDHAFLPNGAVLVNAASADDELGPQDLLPYHKDSSIVVDERDNMWGTFRGKAVNLGMANAEAHSDRVVVREGKELLVVNNGYVVNMTGERDPIPPRYIQLTRSLLLLGALTAKRAAAGELEGVDGNKGGVGIHDVPREWQEALVNLVQRDLKKSGEDLRTPNWETKKADAWAPEEVLTPPPSVVANAAVEVANAAAGKPLLSSFDRLHTFDEGAVPTLPFRKSTTPREDGNKIYGLAIGPTTRGEREHSIAGLVDGTRELSIEGAALYRACVVVNKRHNTKFYASLKAPGQQLGTLFSDKSRVGFTEGKMVAGDSDVPSSGADRFEEVYGHFCATLTSQALALSLKRDPNVSEVAASLRQLFAEQSVDVAPWIAALGRSTDPADAALFAALKD